MTALVRLALLVSAALAAPPASGAARAEGTGVKADADAKACAGKPLPAELLGWTNGVTSVALTKYHPRARLLTERRTTLKLHRADRVAYLVPPGKPVDPLRHGGLMAVRVTKAGQLRIALDGPAWVDLVRDRSAPVLSVAHGHGPECSGIRKIVGFDVTPGRYILQIVNAPQGRISAMALMPR